MTGISPRSRYGPSRHKRLDGRGHVTSQRGARDRTGSPAMLRGPRGTLVPAGQRP